MQSPSFYVLGNLFFVFFSMSHALCPSPAFFFLSGWDLGLIWILPPVILYYSGLVGQEESGPCVSDLETG